MARVFITGTAGLIGYHLAHRLLDEGQTAHRFDGMRDYYDVTLKQRRHSLLWRSERFAATETLLEDVTAVDTAIDGFEPEIIVLLAGWAAVRYSLENPRAYVDANVVGTFNIMEAARRHKVVMCP